MWDDAVSQESAEETEIETINHCPHRARIIEAGRLARAEQAALERQLQLRDGRRKHRGADMPSASPD
jgi:hypothetical protein